MNKLSRVREIENFSGVNINKIQGRIKPLKRKHYRVLDFFPGGDAPKDFIQAYIYGDSGIANMRKWSRYIAKVGHKWYPLESINEYLLNRIGEVLELNMAKSYLRLADNQIRFLSLYFTKEDEELVHGANIFSAYLNENDTAFVEQIESQALSRELFTFQFTVEAVQFIFPNDYELILEGFVKMLVFDAITGNKDRHFYNWGIIKDIRGKRRPTFSPIYDSARGLFWNHSEEKLKMLFKEGTKIDEDRFNVYLGKYIRKSLPKIGWEGNKNINHFDLIKGVYNHYPKYINTCKILLKQEYLQQIIEMLNSEFCYLYSKKRIILIEECIKQRFSILQSICK